MASLESRVTAPSASSSGPQDTASSAPNASEGPKSIPWAEDNRQMDGPNDYSGGSGIADPEFDVEVKLIDQTSPLYSVKTFEELGM